MRLLVTNDDGVHAPGLHALALALAEAGHDVLVAAPTEDCSGWGAGIGPISAGTELDVVAHVIPDADGISTYGIDGPPAMCVLIALLEVFGPRPDMVVSGINLGANTGRTVLQSGTVGAALIAQNFGLSAMAISQDHSGDEVHWATGAAVAVDTVAWLAEAPRKTVLNVNVPHRVLQDVAGVRWGRLAAFGTTSTSLRGDVPGRLVVHVEPRSVELRPDTDTHLLREGYVTVTGLTGIRAEADTSSGAAPHVEDALRERQGRHTPHGQR